jgi:hypothetical protein
VWHWPADQIANSADVAKLAAALGVTGTPQRHAHGWVATSQAGELRVRDGGGAQWSFARSDLLSCPPMTVDVDHGPDAVSAGCAVALSGGTSPIKPGATPPAPPTPSPGPDNAATRAAAQTLLWALGIAGPPRIEPGGSGVSILSVAPTLDALRTQGLDITIGVDSRGVRSATGYLQMPAAGADYPLRSARSAFDALAQMPRPEIAMYCEPMPPTGSAGPVGCPTPKPIRITGATLGLQLHWDGTGSLLVPAWFFTTEGSPRPIAVVAVDPAFIDDPIPPAGTIEPGSAVGSGAAGSGGAASSGGTVGSGSTGSSADPPVVVPPMPAVDDTAAAPVPSP